MKILWSVLALLVIGCASALLWTAANATPSSGTMPGVSVTGTPTETAGPGNETSAATPTTPSGSPPVAPQPTQSAPSADVPEVPAPGPQPVEPIPVDPDNDWDDGWDDGDDDDSDSGIDELND